MTADDTPTDDLWAALAVMLYGPMSQNEARTHAVSARVRMGAVEACIAGRMIFGLMSEDEVVTERAAIRRRLSAEKRRRILAEHQRAASLQSRTSDPGPSEIVEEKVRAATERRQTAAALKERDPKGNRGAIGEHLAAASQLEYEAQMIRDREVNDRWLANATRETLDLARLRGEDIDSETIELVTYPTDEHGARMRHKTGSRRGQVVTQVDRVTRAVIRSRGGGLELALEKGHLDGGPGSPKADALFQTGDRYRQAYEIDEGLTSNSGGGGGGFGPKGPQIRAVEAGEILSIMRGKLTARERHVLDEVCGKGFRVRQVAADMGAGFPATARALRNGLRTAGEQVKAAGEQGRIGVAGERVEAAHRELQKIRL